MIITGPFQLEILYDSIICWGSMRSRLDRSCGAGNVTSEEIRNSTESAAVQQKKKENSTPVLMLRKTWMEQKTGSCSNTSGETQLRYKWCRWLLIKVRPLRRGLLALALTESMQKALYCAHPTCTAIFLTSGSIHAVPLRSSFGIYKALWTCKIFQKFCSVHNFQCFSSP